jgi:hypothetical protein
MKKYTVVFCLLFLLSACASSEEKLAEHFVSNNDGTVSDIETKLMWAASANDRSVTWPEAKEYCENFSGGGYQDWRMPTQSELAALQEAGLKKDEKIIRISSDLIWSSDTDDSRAVYCNFRHSGCSRMEKVLSFALRALPVRDPNGVAVADTAAPAEVAEPSNLISHPQNVEQRLQMLEALRKQELITETEYQQKRAAVLNDI